jgi:hypothetical protein
MCLSVDGRRERTGDTDKRRTETLQSVREGGSVPGYVDDIVIWRLKRFTDRVPDLIIAPGHDLAPLQTAHSQHLIIHGIRPPGSATSPARTPDILQRVVPKPM